ncbi:MAG: DUF5924 family protein [Candidatus Rokuibacteriota bacterium]
MDPKAPPAGGPGSAPPPRAWWPWLRRWGISLLSLIGGLLTLFVFRRELTQIRWFVGSILLIWILFAVLTQVRQALETRGHRLVITAADYLIQSLYHGVLLFLLPVYWASSTLTSINAPFLILIVVLAVLATFDPWYHVVVQPRPWTRYVFFLVSIFCGLNLALPLVGVPPHLALAGAAWASVLALTPSVCRARGWRWWFGLRTMALIGVFVAVAAWWGRAALPPVPLFIAQKTMAWAVTGADALEPVAGTIRADDLRQRGLIAYTAIYAPAGLQQSVRHVWRREGQIVDDVRLSPVRGGRREGFRTYSRKTAFPADPSGSWVVDVITGSEQLLGRLRFHVTR